MSSEGDPKRPGGVAGPGGALALVGVFSITVVVGVVAGALMDHVFHTLPWLTLTGLLVGLAGGTAALYRGLAVYRNPGK